MKRITHRRDEFTSAVWLLGAVFVGVVVLLAGLFSWHFAAAKSSIPVANAAGIAELKTFVHPQLNYSVTYPGDFTLRSVYPRFAQDSDQTALDESFNVSAALVEGSNLVSDSRVLIETSTQGSCSALKFLQSVSVDSSNTVQDNGVTYSYAEGTKVEGGNTYQEIVYALPSSSPCIAVHYYIHSIDITRYAKGSAQAYNHAALLDEFDGIRRSLKVGH